jgi:hypothetical protein
MSTPFVNSTVIPMPLREADPDEIQPGAALVHFEHLRQLFVFHISRQLS